MGGRGKPALAHTGVPVSLCSRSSSLALTTVKNRQKREGGIKGWVGTERKGRDGNGKAINHNQRFMIVVSFIVCILCCHSGVTLVT